MLLMMTMQKLNKNLLGHVVEGDKKLHVCGYTYDNCVWIQSKAGVEKKMYVTYVNNKGVYFNFKGKRMYLPTLK
jgi:hypothetical protein